MSCTDSHSCWWRVRLFLHAFQKADTLPQKTNHPPPQQQKQPVPNPKVSFNGVVLISGTEGNGNKYGLSYMGSFMYCVYLFIYNAYYLICMSRLLASNLYWIKTYWILLIPNRFILRQKWNFRLYMLSAVVHQHSRKWSPVPSVVRIHVHYVCFMLTNRCMCQSQ